MARQETAPSGRGGAVRAVRVRVPAQLRSLAAQQAAVEVRALAGADGTVTIEAVLGALKSSYPGLHHAALDERGAVRPHVNIFVGSENVRFGQGLATPVPPQAEVWILPAVSGG